MDYDELKNLCWQYIDHIRAQGEMGITDWKVSEQKRRDLHRAILNITHLSMFEFGGLPFWYEIKSVDEDAQRLYDALCSLVAKRNRELGT